MDIHCPVCGEPWDHDSLHEEADARFQAKYGHRFRGSTQDNGPAYYRLYDEVSAQFRTTGCHALFGARHNTESPSVLRAQASAALMDIMPDDLDGVAAMMEDFEGMMD